MFEAIKMLTSYQRYLPSALTCVHTSDERSFNDLMPRVDLILIGHFLIKVKEIKLQQKEKKPSIVPLAM